MTTLQEGQSRLIPVNERETMRNEGYYKEVNPLLRAFAAL